MNTVLSLICAASLQWNANPPADNVSKYVLYHSTNLVSGFSKLGETAETTFPLPSLTSGEHFFFVTAVNQFGLESNPSNQVVAPVPYPPQGTRIVIVVE